MGNVMNNMNNINYPINTNSNDNNANKFYKNNTPQMQGSLNSKGSLSMQGIKNTIPNFNQNDNLNFIQAQSQLNYNPQMMNTITNNKMNYVNQGIINNMMTGNSTQNSNKSVKNVKDNKTIKQNVSSFLPNKDNFNSNNNQFNKKHQKQLNIINDNFINNNDYINDINYSSIENNQKSKNSYIVQKHFNY